MEIHIAIEATSTGDDVTIAVDVTGETRKSDVKIPMLPRPIEAMTGAAQLLFHSVTREKLKARAPDILIRPPVGAFGAFDYFKIGDILGAAEASKEELKRKLAQRLDGAG